MAYFKCTSCGITIWHDLRKRVEKHLKDKSKYKSKCGTGEGAIFMMKQK